MGREILKGKSLAPPTPLQEIFRIKSGNNELDVGKTVPRLLWAKARWSLDPRSSKSMLPTAKVK
jgi:hypothetical protein